jgi:23S rRNA (adenine2503-C2)-methyltransferase
LEVKVDQIKTNFFSLSFKDLKNLLKSQNLKEAGASLLFNYVYKKLSFSPEIPNLSKETRDFLIENMTFSLPRITQTQKNTASTVKQVTTKFLMAFPDGRRVESVLIPFQGKYTLCLSSQVGCAMNCSFCYTGTQGFDRHLSTEEIVGQVVSSLSWLKDVGIKERVSNIVFMGQGEPLHNMNAVRKACEIFLSQNGLSLGREKITISTAGYLPGLKDWLNDPLPVNLALSLHSPNDSIRSELIPLNRKYPLREILSVIQKIPLEKKRFVTFEVLLIEGLNDSISFAHETAQLIKDLNPLINLIPFNPFPGTNYARPSDKAIEEYKEVTESYGIATMVRRTKGDAILAACGQLKS